MQNRDENPDVLSDRAQGHERTETAMENNQNESSHSQSLFPSNQSWMYSPESNQNYWNPFRNQWAQGSVNESLIPSRSNQQPNQSVRESLIPSRSNQQPNQSVRESLIPSWFNQELNQSARGSLIPSRMSNLGSKQTSTQIPKWNHGVSERPIQGTLNQTNFHMHPITESQRLRNFAAQGTPPLPSITSYLAGLEDHRNRPTETSKSVPDLESAPGPEQFLDQENTPRNEPAFSRISEFDSPPSFAINPDLPSISGSFSNPWYLSSSCPKTSTQRARLGQQLLGLDSDSNSDSSPIIERRSSVILAPSSQSQENETQIISDSD